jgi:AcrR family transcriptional regulator
MPRLTADERRARILRSSTELFARRGFAATRTKDVARAAGVSEAMVFKLFPDKESLYRAILAERTGEMERVLPLAALAQSGDALDVLLHRIAATVLGRIEDDPSFLRLLLLSALEGHPLADEFDRARGEGARKLVADHLRRRGTAPAGVDPDVAARSFLGLVVWFAMARTVFREPGALRLSREQICRDVVALFLDGVRPRAAGNS